MDADDLRTLIEAVRIDPQVAIDAAAAAADAAAAAAADNLQAFETLIQNARPTVKPEKFKSGDAQDWIEWRAVFVNAAAMGQWNNQKARRLASEALIGTARRMVTGIPVEADGDPDDIDPYEELLDLYQGRFCPAGHTKMCRTEMRAAKQREDEALAIWHGRLRFLYQRAYPNRAEDEVEDDQDLIDMFIKGLLHHEVKHFVWHDGPATYTLALAAANQRASKVRTFEEEVVGVDRQPSASTPVPGLFNMDKGANYLKYGRFEPEGSYIRPTGAAAKATGLKCFACEEHGHVVVMCPYLGKIRKWFDKKVGNSNSNSNSKKNGGDLRNIINGGGVNKGGGGGKKGGGGGKAQPRRPGGGKSTLVKSVSELTKSITDKAGRGQATLAELKAARNMCEDVLSLKEKYGPFDDEDFEEGSGN